MCGICGCSNDSDKHAAHIHEHQGHHAAHRQDDKLILVEQAILAKNNDFAEENKKTFQEKNILALNVMSSPGSGKTTLLAKTIADLKRELDISVVVGDQQTDFDAQQLSASGARAVQINTGKACHLDAHTVGHVVDELSLPAKSLLFIENVGNLVCPALFDLGEAYKVVILAVTEGDNKPLKYPDMFRRADLMIITKIDLLPYVDFDVKQCLDFASRIKPNLETLLLSAKSGEGMSAWTDWIKQKRT